VLLATPAAALVIAVPAGLRLAGEQGGFFEAWFAVAALVCPLVALGISIARGARRSLHTLAPSAGVPLFVGAALFALMSLPATAILGAMLKANTHHRPLAGATFATFALVVHGVAAIVAWRVTVLVLPRLEKQGARTALAVALAAVGMVLVLFTVFRGTSAHDVQAAGSTDLPSLLVDGALGLAAAAVAGVLDVPMSKASAGSWIGAGALLFVAVIGVVLAARSPTLARRIADRAPLAAVVGEVIGLPSRP
jgi:hypothetical protein